ncbi:hypothetical protein QUA70_27155 [Microcoleus sp. LAD1_D5]|uniref:hypothetical protein n=1 Tax=unclassified Microcoleus TaxID=2642155 RepID=UPI002FD04958
MSGRRKFGNGLCTRCNGCQEEGSSATDYVQDVTDVSPMAVGRRKEEEGRRNYDIIFYGAVERCSTYLAALLCLY